MKIAGFGDFLIHFSPVGDERIAQTNLFEMSFTGAEANVCAALAYWGEKAEFVTRIPDNPIAQKGIRFLKSLDVITQNIPLCGNSRMGTYYLENGRHLRPSYVIYDRDNSAFTRSCYEDYNWDRILKDCTAFYLTGITPALSENLFLCCLQILKKVREKNIKVFFDINYRSTLIGTDKARDMIVQFLPYITHIIGNEEHFKMIFGLSDRYDDDNCEKRLYDITSKIHNFTGIDNVAVTVRRTVSASENYFYASYRQNEEFQMSNPRRIFVVDRVGSGDAFSAGLIYGINNGYTAKDCVDFASASAAFKHTVTKDINFASVEEIKKLQSSCGYDIKR